MPEIINKKLITPKELDEANVGLSLVTQWKMRKTGELQFLRVGYKIFYLPEHIERFLANCEQNADASGNVAQAA